MRRATLTQSRAPHRAHRTPSPPHNRIARVVAVAARRSHRPLVACVHARLSFARRWGSIYDEMYFADGLQVADGMEDPTMDWAAYTDSFTGKMHERETIREWVDETVAEIVAFRPRRVIEMGCGKGMILFRVASEPFVSEYHGADLAKQAIAHVERTWDSHYAEADLGPSGLEKLSTHVLDASNFGGFERGSYDAVVCNGVTMYFPSAAYLVDVVSNAVDRIRPGGVMHLGDVISLEAHPYFVLRSARHMSDVGFAELQQPQTRSALMAAAKDRTYTHQLFYELHERGMLPSVAAVEVQLKHGEIMSEFTRYRYNVLFHTGPPVEPLELAALPASAGATLESTVESLVAAAWANPRAVSVCHGVRNARLAADELLANGVADAAAPAVQVGVGEGGGIDPAALRARLAAALPQAHVLVTWAKSGAAAEMDVYVMPKAQMLEGLRAAALDAHATLSATGAAAFDAEAYTNKIVAAETSASAKAGEEISDAVAAELRKLWETGESRLKREALLRILGAKLGLRAEQIGDDDSFAAHGGNSFVAMQIIGQLRSILGVSVPVFSLMTETFGRFTRAALETATSDAGSVDDDAASAAVIIRRRESFLDLELAAELRPPSTSFVFFPMAGGSSRQFAQTYLALSRESPESTFYFVQPAGRDARADEPHASSIAEYCEPIVDALSKNIDELRNGSCVFVGDSWGSIAALVVAHALHERLGFCPTHMVAAGNESPTVVSSQMGLGSYSARSVADLADADLRAFLVASGADESELRQTTISALRADCMLHEAYVRPDEQKPLPCSGMVLFGADDGVTKRSALVGWMDEFTADEFKMVSVPNASHHVFAEQPEAVAAKLLQLVSHPARASSPTTTPPSSFINLTDELRANHLAARGELSPNSSMDLLLGPPCAFVSKQIDLPSLQRFRAGNLSYRKGLPWGARGELSNVLTHSSSKEHTPDHGEISPSSSHPYPVVV